RDPLVTGVQTCALPILARRDNVAAGDDHSVPGGEYPMAGRASSAPTGEAIGWIFALACMTRYEAWPITACALTAAVWTLHGRSTGRKSVVEGKRDEGRM